MGVGLFLDQVMGGLMEYADVSRYRDLKGIFPLLAAKFPQELSQICNDASTSMKRKIEVSYVSDSRLEDADSAVRS